MCSVTHVAAGALIGSLIGNQGVAFLVGFGSHVPLDAVPHFDFEDFRIDAIISVGLLGAILLTAGFSSILWGAVGAVVPDFENLLWKTGIIREKQKIFPTHSGLIGHGRALGGQGVVTEIAVSALSAGMVALAVLTGGGAS